MLKIAPESAIKFAAYEQVKRFIRGPDNRPMSIFERFVAGACAGCVSQTAIYPLEVLKTRLALRKTGQYKGMLDAAMKIHAGEGLRSFYRGYIPNVLGEVSFITFVQHCHSTNKCVVCLIRHHSVRRY